jgi:hypothetical protein
MQSSPVDRRLDLRILCGYEATLRSLSLRPGDSLTIPWMALSIGIRSLVSLLPAIQATGLWLLPRRDCLPLNTPAFAGHAADPPQLSLLRVQKRNCEASSMPIQSPGEPTAKVKAVGSSRPECVSLGRRELQTSVVHRSPGEGPLASAVRSASTSAGPNSRRL